MARDHLAFRLGRLLMERIIFLRSEAQGATVNHELQRIENDVRIILKFLGLPIDPEDVLAPSGWGEQLGEMQDQVGVLLVHQLSPKAALCFMLGGDLITLAVARAPDLPQDVLEQLRQKILDVAVRADLAPSSFDALFQALGDQQLSNEGFFSLTLDTALSLERVIEASQPHLRKRVFIVHGHDLKLRKSVADFVTSLGLEPIIIAEQPNRGRVILEKLLDSSDVGYVIALLTPDDIGHRKSRTDEARPRARQNVIFELGFFLGRIGRERIATLYTGDLEVPSDYLGTAFITDSEDWKVRLISEMRAAGLPC